MESSSSLPEPYESPERSDKKEKKDKDRKSGHGPLRVPLSADALHGVATNKEKRAAKSAEQIGGILPIIPKPERPSAGSAPKAETPAEVPVRHEAALAERLAAPTHAPKPEASTHPELEGLQDELWQDFDAAPPVPFDTEGDRHAAAEAIVRQHAEEDKGDEDDDEEDDTPNTLPAAPAARHTGHQEVVIPKEALERPEIIIPAPEPDPDAWHESHTLHLNELAAPPEPIVEAAPKSVQSAPEDRIAAGPSTEAMAAEVAATEPDPESTEALERIYALPAAELPADHPEAHADPLPPPTEQEQFQDIMQRADFDEGFVRQTSVPRYVAAAPVAPQAAELPSDEPITQAGAVPLTPAVDPSQWYTAARYANRMPGAGFAESVMAGGLAGGIAGAVAGSRAAERVAEHAQTAVPAEQLLQPTIPAGQERTAVYPTPPQEQAQQPLRQPEQPTPLTNEQSTVLPFLEQNRPAAAPAAEAAPRPAPVQQPEQAAGTPAAAAEAAVELLQTPEGRTHMVESAWHRVEVQNGSGRIVEGQPEGRALREEKSVEAGPPDTADDTDTAAQPPAAPAQAQGPIQGQVQGPAGSMYQQTLPGGIAPLLGSGQIENPYELDSGQIDGLHRLEAPRNPVIIALTSPLLWVGIVVLLLAFFAAAFF